jgi:type II secretory pathway component PulF
VRNTWLYPVILVSFGWVVRIGIYLYFGRLAAAANFFWSSFGISLLLFVAGWLLMKRREVKDVVDSLLLQIPIVREAELGLGKVLFFSAFRLVYEAGGLDVVAMFDLASATVRNSAIRRDLLKAREVVQQHGTFEDAFGHLTLLEDRFKGLIATGSISGRLDQMLDKLVALVSDQLVFTLQAFNNVFQRIVAFCVAMSIVETLAVCMVL